MGVAVSQAARSTLQILCWLCFCNPSWDAAYSLPKSAKVQFTRINCDNMQLSVVGVECERTDIYKRVFKYTFYGTDIIYE